MYRLLTFDLDETILQSDHLVSLEDRETAMNLKDVFLVPATGRSFLSIQGTLKELGLHDKKNSYSISFNGSIITENHQNRIIFSSYLAYADVTRLLQIGVEEDLCVHVYLLDETYIYKIYENEKAYLVNRMTYLPLEDPDPAFFQDKKVIKILYANNDMERLKRLRKKLDLEDEYEISLSSNRYLEFNPKGISKGFALKKLCELLKIDIRDTIAVGDSVNDLSMLHAAGKSLAVANAVEEIKNDCDDILDADHNHSPLTEIIDKYIR